ncbi:MAG: glycosyltransferase [Bacteroidetes bacterium]|nr:glycosyltransferase [Bacteroidota bacterium]
MGFANHYLNNYRIYPDYIETTPDINLNLIVFIPCYNEPNLTNTLDALYNCKRPKSPVEIIIVINSSIDEDKQIIENNLKTLQQAEQWIKEHNEKLFSFYTIYQPNLQKKYAGVGFARKIGMDEAVSRFNKINNSKGILIAFDADATCDDNFFTEIENHFAKNSKATACSIYYEHPISGTQFSESIYKTITQYELYLRYYNLSLRYANFPFAYHTVGSSFAVKADIYAKQGGMNRKKAGEDFYFLQKVIPLGNFTELHTTRVIPSPRPSDRVPFGTGATIKKFEENNITDLYTYNFQAFIDLKSFLSLIDKLYKIEASKLVDFYKKIPENIKEFLIANNFNLAINDINNNCSNLTNFKKRFFAWLNAFKVLKYMNFTHEHNLQKVKITEVASQLLKKIKSETQIPNDEKQLLEIFRSIEKNRRLG